MRKGIIFSLTAIFLFTSVIAAATSVSVRINDETRMINQEIPLRTQRDNYEAVSRDIADLFKTKAITNGNITIIEEMPNDINSGVSSYELFLNKTARNVIITTKEEALYLGNHSKITYGLNKTWFNLTSNESINYYELSINKSVEAVNIESDFSWVSIGTYVNLAVMDNTGLLLINGSISGHVNPQRLNTFNITFDDGSIIKVSLKDYYLFNTTGTVNTSTKIGLTGDVYTGHITRVTNRILESVKEYRTIIRGQS